MALNPVIQLQLEKARVRLADLLDANLTLNAARQKPQPKIHTALRRDKPDIRVLVNTSSGAYHCSGTQWFGKTHEGDSMTQKESQAPRTWGSAAPAGEAAPAVEVI
jgi:hypothetical protein